MESEKSYKILAHDIEINSAAMEERTKEWEYSGSSSYQEGHTQQILISE